MKNIIKYLILICIINTGNNYLHAQDDGGRCATITTLEELQYLEECRDARRAIAEKNRTNKERAPINYIPVHHVIIRKSDGTGGVAVADIQTMMANLNNFYLEGDIQFFACDQIEYVNSDQYYSIEIGAESTDMYDTYDRDDKFVIYYVNEIVMQGSNGWCGVRSGGGDHIIMDDECLDGTTISHELGHYFGLAHTHGSWNCPPDNDPDRITDEWVDGSNSATTGDRIEDTPADPNMGCGRNWVNSSCAYTGTVRDQSPQQRLFTPLTNNIMSYGRGSCKTSFTPDQWAQVQFTLWDRHSHLLCIPCNTSIADLNVTANISSGSKRYESLDDIFVKHTVTGTANADYIARKKVVLQGTTKILSSGGASHIFIDSCVVPPNPPSVRGTGTTVALGNAKEGESILNSINIFPNPVSDVLWVKSKQEIESITCTNVIGQFFPVVFKAEQIFVSELPPGIYLLNITTRNEKRSIHKFIKE